MEFLQLFHNTKILSRSQRGSILTQPTAQLRGTTHLRPPPRTRRAISASLEASPSRPSTAHRISASLEATPRQMELAIHLLTRLTDNGIKYQPLHHRARVRRRQAAMPHSERDRSPVRQLRSLCRHPQRCCNPVRTCLTPVLHYSAYSSYFLLYRTLERGTNLDRSKTPASRTLGALPAQAQRTVPSTATTMTPTGVTRTPTRSPQD
jgi:hypothetical protein